MPGSPIPTLEPSKEYLPRRWDFVDGSGSDCITADSRSATLAYLASVAWSVESHVFRDRGIDI
ncbi:hypothetical protein N7447_008174 [Penicillium robsamsonii]|uniref:uncharacterized protein n=1 Tax=Penicillium robsamsonii TaxID=1792511 RepID=UPI00254805DF|nr:uncharacterized protein N7447_008174 [Penicillium robsamsonii]KAJ5815941.1 hypothetical protein N7447_008174 [Penicillium robsamsonii]